MFEQSELRRIQSLLNYIFNAEGKPDVDWWGLEVANKTHNEATIPLDPTPYICYNQLDFVIKEIQGVY